MVGTPAYANAGAPAGVAGFIFFNHVDGAGLFWALVVGVIADFDPVFSGRYSGVYFRPVRRKTERARGTAFSCDRDRGIGFDVVGGLVANDYSALVL